MVVRAQHMRICCDKRLVKVANKAGLTMFGGSKPKTFKEVGK